MLFLHRNAMKASTLFQSLDNARLKIADKELYHDYRMISVIAQVKCCFEERRETESRVEGRGKKLKADT
jgi:hypothetical protein